VLRETGLAGHAHLFVATRSGLAGVRAMVSSAWDLAAIEQEYEQFIAEFAAGDPALPRELLPARWSGLKAARLFAGRHERWSDGAQIEWKRLNHGG